jgi:parallel beta-helix repeat protein
MKKMKSPFITASFGLSFFTILMIGAICYAYFGWYENRSLAFLYNKNKVETMTVSPQDNLSSILSTVNNYTILKLKPGKYVGQFLLKNKEKVNIMGTKGVFFFTARETSLTVQDCKNCIVENITIQTEDKKKPAIVIQNTENLNLNYLQVQGSTLIQAGCNQLKLKNINSTDNIRIDESKNIQIMECELKAKTEHSLILTKIENISISNSTIQGISFENISGEENLIRHNTINSNNIKAIAIKKSQNIFLDDNNIASEADDGIYVINSSYTTVGKKGNKIKSSQGYTIIFSGCNNCILQGNSLLNQDDDKKCVVILSSRSISCKDNTILGTPEYDSLGKIKALAGGGVYIRSSKEIILEDNTIKESIIGIRVDKDSEGTFLKNRICDNYGNGFEIENSQATLSENTISQNIHGIQWKNSQGTIQDNTISSNKNDGILLDKSNPLIQGNTITRNTSNGISLKGNSQPIIQNNNIQNNQYGIAFFQPNRNEYSQNNFVDNKQGNYSH